MPLATRWRATAIDSAPAGVAEGSSRGAGGGWRGTRHLWRDTHARLEAQRPVGTRLLIRSPCLDSVSRSACPKRLEGFPELGLEGGLDSRTLDGDVGGRLGLGRLVPEVEER